MVNLPIEYSDKPVTPFGGMALMKRFVDQTGIREHLATLDLPQGGSNRAYDPVQIIESFWLSIWTGASRYIHCDWLRQDQTLAAIFGYESLPSQSTYSRFFGKFSQARNTVVFPALQKWFFAQINVGAVTVDFDSTVITRDGSQEGAAKGCNPNRKGAQLAPSAHGLHQPDTHGSQRMAAPGQHGSVLQLRRVHARDFR
ncbi:MAG: transposase [Verrucomicrobiaceae bacterium]|nr:transposase [Verrucomicrobiaceae bacterium]